MTVDQTLMAPTDLVDFVPTSQHAYIADRCAFIVPVEENLFRWCWGWSWYEALIDDLVQYSETPGDGVTTITHFVQGGDYTAGQHVEQESRIYKCIANVTGASSVRDRRYFARAPKFATEANEYLWRRYMGKILAFTVMNESVMYRLLRDTPKGLVKNYDEGSSKPATAAEAQLYKSEAARDVDKMTKVMDAYLAENTITFPLYKSGLDCATNCSPAKSIRRNFGFNVEPK